MVVVLARILSLSLVPSLALTMALALALVHPQSLALSLCERRMPRVQGLVIRVPWKVPRFVV